MTRLHRIHAAVLLLVVTSSAPRALDAQRADAPEILLRLDDIGMNHSVNLAVEQVVERELTAQVERALASGLKISYVDGQMGMVEATPQLKEVEERVARRYGLGISTRCGESYHSLWGVPVAQKKSALLVRLAEARRDSVNLIEVHVAERTPEMEVIVDMNAPSQNTPDAASSRTGRQSSRRCCLRSS